ncbi:hypothetical protein [Bacillus sp. FJAT-27445]|uniref:hypothetical protein n=1 Tax=Bacillus sp. FJAT-27445 TaxID=1679166 RepID=UPI0020A40F71|nr:hypothetical protein [Bacillus sp. FJAT-27445]
MADGKAIVDHVMEKGKAGLPPLAEHEIQCECGEAFVLKTVVMNCPKCEMTYGVTPCSSGDKNNIKPAGIAYA